MREFFHGWRRKAGLVALGLNCLALPLWARSVIFVDGIGIPIVSRQHVIESVDQKLYWRAFTDPAPKWGFETQKRDRRHGNYLSFETRLFYADMEIDNELQIDFREWRLHYWIAVLSGALLSSALILVPARKRACPN